MNQFIRAGLFIVLIAGLGGCSGVRTTLAESPPPAASPIQPDAPVAQAPPSLPAPSGLDDYKTQVARHVLQHNPNLAFAGTLPPLMPAIVVLRITVDRYGELKEVEVQRSRDANASRVAVDSMWRSLPLPPPQRLAQADGRLTFSETFLFGERYRYQLRSLEPPQAGE
jgi:periplasmic protein TonB